MKQYTYESAEPTYTFPDASVAGDEYTVPPVVYDHTDTPALEVTAYTTPEVEPKYTVAPSTERAGDEVTDDPAPKFHFTVPAGLTAYKLALSLPM